MLRNACFVFFGLLLYCTNLWALRTPQSLLPKKSQAEFLSQLQDSIQWGPRLAQIDDTYDPFADFSEFENNSDEEADIHFFTNGRFITVGFFVGARGFTDEMTKTISPGPTYGLYLSYFFDLRFALQVSVSTGNSDYKVNTTSYPAMGNVTHTAIGIHFKYYLNTQNVTKGLASLNPYFILGFSQMYRTIVVNGLDGYAKRSGLGLDGGLGIEVPLMRNKMFFGLQGLFQMINFGDQNEEITDGYRDPTSGEPDPQPAGLFLKGNSFTGIAILGVNF